MFYLWCRLMIWRLPMFFLLAISFTYDIYSHDSWIKNHRRLPTADHASISSTSHQ